MYPFARKERPSNEYLDVKIPWDSVKKLYKFIKRVWTNKKDSAATSFKIEKWSSGSSLRNFCQKEKDDISIISPSYDVKDDAKAINLALPDEMPEPPTKTPGNGVITAWSCTENLSGPCGGEKLFLCWKWMAKETGKGYKSSKKAGRIEHLSHKMYIIVSPYTVTDIARMFLQKEHHKSSG